jgi:hypothetical protein
MEIWANRRNKEARMTALPAHRVCVLLLFFAAQAAAVRAQDPVAWKSGKALETALADKISYTWSERPLREGLVALGRSAGVAILLDRRVDPDQRVDSSARDASLRDALGELAAAQNLALGSIGAVTYIAAPDDVARAEGITELRRSDVKKLAAPQRWIARQKTEWPELTRPRELAQQIAAGAGAKMANPDAIPHDLWPAWSGPPLPLADQLTLVLAGFGLTYELSAGGDEVTIVSMPDEIVYEKLYPVRGAPSIVARDLQQKLAGITAKAEGTTRIRVTASAADHARIAQLLAGERTTTRTVVTPGEKVYTLTVENQPLGAILRTIAKELDVEVKAETALIEKLKERTSVKVTKVSAEQLLRQLLEPAGIKYRLTDETLELSE